MIDAPSSTWFTVSPEWGWLIALYFFFGGLAAGSYLLAVLIDFLGAKSDRPLARLGYYTAIPCLMICGVLLIADLSRPDRFWHLFVEIHTFRPMLKPWSPMSMGSWALPLFSFFAVLSFVGALSESGRVSWRGATRLRPPHAAGKVVGALGALLAFFVGGYSGVLLAVTNRPIWADTTLLGMLLLVSAISISAAFMLFLAQRRAHFDPRGLEALRRVGVSVIALEILVLIAVVVSLGPAARGWLNGWGLLLLLAVTLNAFSLPPALGWFRDAYRRMPPGLAPLGVLAAGLILRGVLVYSSEAITL